MATASRLESILKCAVCLDSLKDPRHLVCGHVFCQQCVHKLTDPRRRNIIIRCPTCRRPCQLADITEIFILKDIIDVQKSNSAPSTQLHSCRICQQAFDVNNMWVCDGCDAKMTCSTCLIKKNHGSQCETIPRKLAEFLTEKHNALLEWRQATFDPRLNHLVDSVEKFSAQLEEANRRISGIRTLLADRNGDASLITFRGELSSIQNLAAPLVQFSAGDPSCLGDSSLTIESDTEAITRRIEDLQARIDSQLRKFERCFAAIETIREILNDQANASDQSDQAAQPPGTSSIGHPPEEFYDTVPPILDEQQNA